MVLKKYIARQRELKKIELEAWKLERKAIKSRRDKKQEKKRKAQEFKARQKGRASAYTPLGLGIDVKKKKKQAKKVLSKAADIGDKYNKLQKSGQLYVGFGAAPKKRK